MTTVFRVADHFRPAMLFKALQRQGQWQLNHKEAVDMKKLFIVFGLAMSLIACSPSESQEERLSKAQTLSEEVEAVIYAVPESAYVIESTAYMAIVFERDSTSLKGNILNAKRLMPVLLERYPNVDRFFIAWAKGGRQFLKIQFERDQVQHVDWKILHVSGGEVQAISSMYWAAPGVQ